MEQAASASLRINQPAPQPSSSSERVGWVDNAKGICIILVVMMHTALGLEQVTGQKGWMHALVEFSRPFRMPDFFMISGLFLTMTIDRPWRLYLDRKAAHFFYFYILWVLIQFGFKAPFMMNDGASLAVVIKSLFFTLVQPFGTLWFIYMLPVFFVVTKLCRSQPWLLLASAAILQILPISTHEFFPTMTQMLGVISVDSHWILIDEFCSFYVYFLIGYLFATHIFKLADWASDNRFQAIGLLTGWFGTNLVLVLTGVAFWPVVSLLLGVAGAAAIVIFARLIESARVTRILTHIGANSIVIYLSFFLPMIISRLVLNKYFGWMDAGTMALTSIIFSVATPLIGYAIIKKIGFGHFLFHRPQWAIFAHKPKTTKASLAPAQ